MKKIAGIALTVMVGLGMLSTSAMADANKGQKIYSKKLKKACGFSGAAMAGKHTQDEWQEIMEDGKMMEEIQTQCPNLKGLQEKYIQDLYDFFHMYGSDSGNVPAC